MQCQSAYEYIDEAHGYNFDLVVLRDLRSAWQTVKDFDVNFNLGGGL